MRRQSKSGSKPKRKARVFADRVVHHDDGTRSVHLTADGVDVIDRQRAAFRAKFGRDPRGDDPLMFDPDADVPTPLSEEKITATVVDAFRRAGVSPEVIYAFQRTGRIVTTSNRHLLSAADIDEWNAAIEEFRSGAAHELEDPEA